MAKILTVKCDIYDTYRTSLFIRKRKLGIWKYKKIKSASLRLRNIKALYNQKTREQKFWLLKRQGKILIPKVVVMGKAYKDSK